MRKLIPGEEQKEVERKAYALTLQELEKITDGLSIDDLIESIDQTLLFLLFNAHILEMEAIKGHPKSLQALKKFLKKIREEVKE